MGSLMIVNGSPRAPRSNSKKLIEIFRAFWHDPVTVWDARSRDLIPCCTQTGLYRDLLLVFPLYADTAPIPVMRFLKELEQHLPAGKPTVHVLINCGFIEPEQNRIACDMVRLFCRQNGFPFGSALLIGSGEAILNTPFAFLVRRKLRTLARAVRQEKPVNLTVTMPLSKKLFIRASTTYWTQYGAKNGISREQMETLEIE